MFRADSQKFGSGFRAGPARQAMRAGLDVPMAFEKLHENFLRHFFRDRFIAEEVEGNVVSVNNGFDLGCCHLPSKLRTIQIRIPMHISACGLIQRHIFRESLSRREGGAAHRQRASGEG